jgi:hypothetical protein
MPARLLAALLLLLALLASSPPPTLAQPKQGDPPTIGLGVALQTAAIAPSSAASSAAPYAFTVPITFNRVRLEPQFGYVRRSQSEASQSQSISALTFGTGAFYQVDAGSTRLLAGGRIGVTREVQTFESGSAPDERLASVNLFLGPAVGGEYYVSEHFSVGAEAHFYYINLGQPDEAPPERSASVVRTGGAAFLRFHF